MRRALAPCLAALALAGAPAAAEGVLRVDPQRSAVRFELAATLHTVYGEGRVLRGELRFDPAGGPASGAVVVDARSFATGIAARDRNMHEQVLESGRFPEIRFEAERLEVEGRGPDAARVVLHGALEIHGGRRALAVPARVAREGGALRVEASFAVPYVAWGLRDVSNLLLRVADTVQVQLELVGELSLPEGAERASRAAP
jgi:polyisoprenoid-binding protein YceI